MKKRSKQAGGLRGRGGRAVGIEEYCLTSCQEKRVAFKSKAKHIQAGKSKCL